MIYLRLILKVLFYFSVFTWVEALIIFFIFKNIFILPIIILLVINLISIGLLFKFKGKINLKLKLISSVLLFINFLNIFIGFTVIPENKEIMLNKTKLLSKTEPKKKPLFKFEEKNIIKITSDTEIFFFNNTIPKISLGTVKKGDIFYIFEEDKNNFYLAFTYKIPLSKQFGKLISKKEITSEKSTRTTLKNFYKDYFLASDCARVYTQAKYPYRAPEKLDSYYYARVDYERFLNDKYKLNVYRKYFENYNDILRKQIISLGDNENWTYGTISENENLCKINETEFFLK